MNESEWNKKPFRKNLGNTSIYTLSLTVCECKIKFSFFAQALASGLAPGFGSGVARLSDILIRPDASANGHK